VSSDRARGPTDHEVLAVMVLNQRRSARLSRQLDESATSAQLALRESDALVAELAHLIEDAPRAEGHPLEDVPTRLPGGAPSAAEGQVWQGLVDQAGRQLGPALSYRDLLSPSELLEVHRALEDFHEEHRAVHALDGWDLAAASISGIIAGALDLILVGSHTAAMGAKLASLLGCPTVHSGDSPKVSFDHVLSAEHGAKGNHRWNSASHHVGLWGLVSAVRDVMAGTSTHIVDGRVVIVAHMNAGVAGTLAGTPLADPSAGLLSKVMAAIGLVLRHWQSDVNTSLGLPGPWMLLAKLLNVGSLPDGDGGQLTIAELAGKLYANGMDLRRFVGDSITVLVNEVVVRLWAFARRLAAGGSLRDALDATSAAGARTRKMLLTAHLMTAGCNAGTVYLSSNPMNVNIAQWTAALTYLARHAKWAVFDAADEEDAAHRARWTQGMRAAVAEMGEVEGRLRGVRPVLVGAG
jgi:hypothetical protein